MLTTGLLLMLLLVCGAHAGRTRTVRRDLEIEQDEREVISKLEAFTEDLEPEEEEEEEEGGEEGGEGEGGNAPGEGQGAGLGSGPGSWGMNNNMGKERGPLLRGIPVVDSVLHLCLMSGVYTYKAAAEERSERQLWTDNVVERLFKILSRKRNDVFKRAAEGEHNDDPEWDSNPKELLKDADIQFNNLCVTLLEIRRLSKLKPMSSPEMETTTEIPQTPEMETTPEITQTPEMETTPQVQR